MSAAPVGLPADVVRARRDLLSLYFLTGVAVATWLSRLPSIRSALDLTTAGLGSVLVVGSIGSFLMVVVAGGLTNRWGSARTLLTGACMFSFANVLIGIAPTAGGVPLLAIGMLISSSSYALANVPLNLESVVIERAMRRTVVPQFHAAFSVGSVAGSLLGAGVSWLGVPVLWHFVGLSAVTLVWRWTAIPSAVLGHVTRTVATVAAAPDAAAPDAMAPDAAAPARRGAGMRAAFGAWREPRTLLIGLIVMTASLSEGSANNWLSIAVVDGFREQEAVGAIVFGVFTAGMLVARLAGTRLIDRYGRVTVLVASGVCSLAGLVLFGAGPALWTAAVGALGWGLGAGLVIPIGMASVSGDRLRMAGRVSVLSTFSSVASIGAPPLIGVVAQVMGTRHALLFVGVGFLLATVLARNVAPVAAQGPAAARPTAAGRVPSQVTTAPDDAVLAGAIAVGGR